MKKLVLCVSVVVAGLIGSVAWAAQPAQVSSFGSFGSGDGQFEGPVAIAADASHVYVLDSGDDTRIEEFDASGTFIRSIVLEGMPNLPAGGLAIGSNGNIYTTNPIDGSVRAYTPDGVNTVSWSNHLATPVGIAADGNGHIYVTDLDNGVVEFGEDGSYIRTFGSFGSGDGQLEGPRGIAIDTIGNVYVADTDNARIEVFTADGSYLTQWASDATYVATDGAGSIYATSGGTVRRFTADTAQRGQFSVGMVAGIAAVGKAVYVLDPQPIVNKFLFSITPPVVTSPTDSQTVTPDANGTITLTGTTRSRMEILPSIDGVIRDPVTADADGHWSYSISGLAPGNHTAAAIAQFRAYYAFMPNSSQASIDVVNVSTHEFVQRLEGFSGISDVVYGSNDMVYASISGTDGPTLAVVDGATFQTTALVPVTEDNAAYGMAVAVNPDASRAYMSYVDGDGNDNVAVVDTSNNTLVDTISLGLAPYTTMGGIAINPVSGHLWVRDANGIDVYLPDHSHLTNISFASSEWPANNIEFSADGSTAYTGDTNSGHLFVINLAEETIQDVTLAEGIKGVRLSPDGSLLYAVLSWPTKAIYVLDTSNNTVVDAYDTVQPPESIDITPNGLYIAGDDHGSGEIYFGDTDHGASVLDTTTAPDGGSYYAFNMHFTSPANMRDMSSETVNFTVTEAAGSGSTVSVPPTTTATRVSAKTSSGDSTEQATVSGAAAGSDSSSASGSDSTTPTTGASDTANASSTSFLLAAYKSLVTWWWLWLLLLAAIVLYVRRRKRAA